MKKLQLHQDKEPSDISERDKLLALSSDFNIKEAEEYLKYLKEKYGLTQDKS